MPSYNIGDTVHVRFTLRQGGAKTNADSTPVASVYANSSFKQTIPVSNPGTGDYQCSYDLDSSIAAGTTIAIVIEAVVNGDNVGKIFHSSVIDQSEPASLDTNAIADSVLARDITSAIASQGTIGRHSLASVVLKDTNSSSVNTGTGPELHIKHPDSDVVLHSYQLVVGPGCPVQEIT